MCDRSPSRPSLTSRHCWPHRRPPGKAPAQRVGLTSGRWTWGFGAAAACMGMNPSGASVASIHADCTPMRSPKRLWTDSWAPALQQDNRYSPAETPRRDVWRRSCVLPARDEQDLSLECSGWFSGASLRGAAHRVLFSRRWWLCPPTVLRAMWRSH